MSKILESLKDREVRRYDAGQPVIREGEKTDCLYFLIEGSVEVLKDDVPVAVASQPGIVFGEMAVLLGVQHTATVRTVKPCSFYIVENPREFFATSPAMCLHVCELLARRIDSLNKYLVDVKHQFEGHDHLGMVDKVLEALLHRQPRERIRPKESTIRHGQSMD
ncbi:MAG TPA: cyclic nucleotide-binding domain-containing protein [Candidatus Eisenbacteria bacterium]|nr:cyclic nucleotide-binding domain-containing protein [Candidatus Eisenbacteria bacterium]